MTVDRVAGQLGARQYGLLTGAQLSALGMSRGQLRRRVEDGRLRVVRQSVYRIAGVPPTWEQTVLAAVLAAGAGAAASHATAGALWHLKHCDQYTSAGVHVTAGHRMRLAGVTGHCRTLEPGTRCTYRGIPVTTPEQTILDLAGTLTPEQLGECIDDALRRHLIHLDRLRRLVDAAAGPGRRRLRPLRRALADRIPGYDPGDSDWERRMDHRWEQLGLPSAVRQYRVRVNGHHYRLDLAIPELKIGVEWNGFESHGTRSGFDHDSDKRADLTAAGWHMLDFTSRSSPERICRAVLAAVNQRQRQHPSKPSAPSAASASSVPHGLAG